jgi:hypothetical protein
MWPQLVPSKVRSQCIQRFCASTGNRSCAQTCCAVCGENHQHSRTTAVPSKVFADKYGSLVRPWTEVTELFAENPELLDYGVPDLDGKMLLEPLGIEQQGTGKSKTVVVHVCRLCNSALRRNKLPARSLANGRWNGVGSCPPELQDLTVPERMVLGLYRSRIHMVRLGYATDEGSKRLALHGHVITFPQPPGEAIKSLPRPVSELADTIRIVFVGSELPSHEVITRYTVIRRHKVLAALKWLKTNNRLWRAVEIDMDAVKALPKHGVPVGIQPVSVNSDELGRLIAADRNGYAKGVSMLCMCMCAHVIRCMLLDCVGEKLHARILTNRQIT